MSKTNVMMVESGNLTKMNLGQWVEIEHDGTLVVLDLFFSCLNECSYD